MASDKISVIIHTYNSEKYLEEVLESVTFADEVLICDMYSTDRTIEIAKRFNCRIVYHENVGFADPARNFAISQAANDWIFVLDSDEVVSKQLFDYIRQQITSPNPPDIIAIPRKNYFLGKVMRAYYPNYCYRVFKKGKISYSDKVHCIPSFYGPVHEIPRNRKDLAIIHYAYETTESFVQRMNRYTTLEIEKRIQRKSKFSLFYMISRPLNEFFKRYILKFGFLDGIEGFIYANMCAFYEFTEAAKFFEYVKNTKK